MADKPVQIDEGASASFSTSACDSVHALSSTSSSTSVSVSVPSLSSTSASVSLPASSSTSSSTSASVSVAASASAYASALALASASTTAKTVVSPSALSSLSELASAAWATDSAPKTSTSWAPQPLSKSSSVPWRLTDELPIKLEGVNNIVAWKKQVVRVLISENMLGLVTSPVIPKKYASEMDRSRDNVREEYRKWVIQDQGVRTWLLSSLSESVCSFVRGKEHAWEVWSGVLEICRNELIRNMKTGLREEIKNTKKGNQSVRDYVSRITALIGTLVALGDNVSEQDHVDAILEGLPDEYESLRAIIRARRERATVSHLESLMTIQETLVNNLESEVPLETLLPLGSLHVVTPGHSSNDNVDGAGRGRGGGQRGGRGGRYSGRRR